MKHLRVALESGDAVEALSNEQTVAQLNDVSDQLDDSAPSEVSLESFVRKTNYPLVIRSDFAVVSAEALSEGMINLITVIIAAVVLLIIKLTGWLGKKSSSGGSSSGGGGVYIRFRTEQYDKTNEYLRERERAFKDMDDELRKRGPGVRMPTPGAANKTVDLNARPSNKPEEMVRSVDDAIDVVYKDVNSDDKKRFLDVGDPYLADLVDKTEHYDTMIDVGHCLPGVVSQLRKMYETLRGAASHDVSNDLAAGHLREVYDERMDQIKYGRIRSTPKEMGDKLRETLALVKAKTQVNHRGYTELQSAITNNYASLQFQSAYEEFDKGTEFIEKAHIELVRLKEVFEKHNERGGMKTDSSDAAVKQFSDYIASCGRFIAAMAVLLHHYSTYDEELVRAMAAFARLGDHAIATLFKNLDPHLRSEFSDSYEKARESAKGTRLLK